MTMPKLQTHRLQNGLTILLQENPARPLVALDYWVRAGAADEPDELNGISHFLEHMAFKGNDEYGPAEIDHMIESVGGVWNAATSHDYTHYHINVASEFLPVAAQALYQIVSLAAIRPDETDREREVILEEYARKQDHPAGVLYEELYAQAFQTGPYRNSVLGRPETLATITAQRLKDYYQRHYAPENCVLAVVGAVTMSELLTVLAETFDRDQRRYAPLRTTVEPTAWATGSSATVTMDVQDAYLGLAWPAPSIERPRDLYAFDILATILGDGRSSRLYRQIKEEKRLVSTISASFGHQRYETLLSVVATLDPAQMEPARQAIRDVCMAIADGVTAREMERARRIIEADLAYATETNAGLARFHGEYHLLTGSPLFVETYLDEIRRVTAADVVRVARKYLAEDASAEVKILPNPRP